MTSTMNFALPALAALALSGCSVFGGEAAKEPPYRLIDQDPPHEIRAYPALAVARTQVDAPYGPAVREGFGRLFDYITGSNEGGGEIAMTAPVLTQPAGAGQQNGGQEIAMTAPVLTQETAQGWTVYFVLPAEMTEQSAPRPTDPAVSIATLPPRRVAVARFSGRLTEPAIREARAGLLAWLEARGEPADGPWQAAGYNPPWTIPAYRRNEILITLPDEPPG